MATFKKVTLLNQLKTSVAEILQTIESVPAADISLMNKQPGYHKWSGAQVLEHLNFYNNTYLPAIEARMIKPVSGNPDFQSGWLGNYFTKVMLPGEDGGVANKMSAPKDSRPQDNLDAAKVVTTFINGQKRLLQLLEKAESSDLNVRIPTSISKLIRLKAGDTFRFLVAHQQRHMAQFKRTLDAVR